MSCLGGQSDCEGLTDAIHVARRQSSCTVACCHGPKQDGRLATETLKHSTHPQSFEQIFGVGRGTGQATSLVCEPQLRARRTARATKPPSPGRSGTVLLSTMVRLPTCYVPSCEEQILSFSKSEQCKRCFERASAFQFRLRLMLLA